jgi:hypothetical protein
VDILELMLDANGAGTYLTVHGADHFDRVIANIQCVQKARQERQSPQPLVVPSLTRCAATLQDMEGFYDRWIRTTGSAVIHGYNHYCGQLSEDAVASAEPLIRGACRRLASRIMLLADGRAVLCSQDFAGRQPLGDWTRESLAEIWSGAARVDALSQHGRLELRTMPLCGSCREWFRP